MFGTCLPRQGICCLPKKLSNLANPRRVTESPCIVVYWPVDSIQAEYPKSSNFGVFYFFLAFFNFVDPSKIEISPRSTFCPPFCSKSSTKTLQNPPSRVKPNFLNAIQCFISLLPSVWAKNGTKMSVPARSCHWICQIHKRINQNLKKSRNCHFLPILPGYNPPASFMDGSVRAVEAAGAAKCS